MMDGGERLVKGPIPAVIEPGPDIIHHGDKLSPKKTGEVCGRRKSVWPCFPRLSSIRNVGGLSLV